MNFIKFIFYFFEAIAVCSAIGILFTRNVFHGVLWMIVCLLAVAGIYIIAFAEFVAVTQILIYVGGILVLMIFGIMLTAKLLGKSLTVSNRNWIPGVLVGVSFFLILLKFFSETNFSHKASALDKPIETIGMLIMTEYLIPFEIAGILLLMALVGATLAASVTIEKRS